MRTGWRRCLAAMATMAAINGAPAAPGSSATATVVADKASTTAPATFRDIKWAELVPKGWDPAASFRKRHNIGAISDADPRAWKLMKEMRLFLDQAPTVDSLNGSSVRIPGYVVPLETSRGALKEFLLVPYFGACIHTPPPPANQVIFVVVKPPAEGFRTMDAVWVSGTLSATRVDTFAGASGDKIDASAVERYVGAPTY